MLGYKASGMKNIINKQSIFIMFMVGKLFPAPLFALTEPGFSARDSALGGAMTAMADDAASMNYNPAGLVHLIQNEASSTYGFLNSGVRGADNASDWALNAGVPINRRFGAVGLTWRDTTERGQHREQMASLGYGKYILGRFAVGLGTRYLNRRPDVSSTLGLDLGVLAQFGESWSVGVSANGVNEPDPSAHFNNKGTVRYGAAFRKPKISLSSQFNVVRSSDGSGRDLFMTLACEKWWLSREYLKSDIALRGAWSLSTDDSSLLSAGMGFRTHFLQFDYAFMLPVLSDAFSSARGSHRLTLTYGFGQSAPNKKSAVGKSNLKRLIAVTRQEIDFYKNLNESGLAQVKYLKASLAEQTKEPRRAKELYRLNMTRYWAQKDQGAPLPERVELLKTVIGAFKPLGITVKGAEKELLASEKSWERGEQKWAADRGEYSKGVAGLEDPMERIKKIIRLEKKYAPSGHSMDFVEGELFELEKFNE